MKSVFCIAVSETQAADIVNALKRGGFSNDDISALLPDKTGTMDFAHEHHTKAPEGTAFGGGSGAALGAIFGWLAGAGILAVPGLMPLLAAGPVLGALSGAAVGTAVGALVGALVGMGIPEFEARRYDGKIPQGNILISVHCAGDGAVREARDIFRRAGARDVAVRATASIKREPEATPSRAV